ncbi:MAG: acyltransferase [Magnetococcales bacterium]|nr:acyltransferase [Magnetococcales bacterium]
MGFVSTRWFYFRCRLVGITPGKNIKVDGAVILRSSGGRLVIGDRVFLVSSSWRCTASSLNHPVRFCTHSPDAKIVIGDGCGLNGTSITCRSTTIKVGDGVMIGPNVVIVDSDFHHVWPPEERLQPTVELQDQAVDIGNQVWIGMNVTILKGVTIGQNSVIAAGSVVVKSIPENSLAAGNPAKVIKRYVADNHM